MTQTDKTLVMTVPKAGRLLGLSRNAAYEAARNGDIPVVRIGRLLKVPKLAFEKMLNVETGADVHVARLKPVSDAHKEHPGD